jgi:hypothetical protein
LSTIILRIFSNLFSKIEVVLEEEKITSTINESQKADCHKIIHAAAVSGAGLAAGMAQLPGADVPLLIGIEIAMTISL